MEDATLEKITDKKTSPRSARELLLSGEALADNPWEQLLDEVMVVVLCMLDARDLCRASGVCKRWKRIADFEQVQDCSSEIIRFAKYAYGVQSPRRLHRPPDMPCGIDIDPDPTIWPGLTWDFEILSSGQWVLSYGINPRHEPQSALYLLSGNGEIVRTLERGEHQSVVSSNETHLFVKKSQYQDDSEYPLDFFDIWSLASMEKVTSIRTGCSMLCFSIASDGRLYGGLYSGEIYLLDQSGEIVNTLIGHTEAVNCLLLWEDRLFSGGQEGAICVWESSSNKHLMTLSGNMLAIMTLVVAQNGTMEPKLCSGSFDGEINIWSMDGSLLQTLVGHFRSVSALAYSPISGRLYSSSEDETIRVWNLSGTLLETIQCEEEIDTLAWSPDGKLYSAGLSDLGVRIW